MTNLELIGNNSIPSLHDHIRCYKHDHIKSLPHKSLGDPSKLTMPIFNWPRMVKKLKIDFLFCINHFRCDCVECLHFNMDDIGGITFIKLTGLNFGGITPEWKTLICKIHQNSFKSQLQPPFFVTQCCVLHRLLLVHTF